ncbi:unnamed protein product [marine sediment metagenome]|uniref:Uncharacterized protein n=1 Tax=marine sediment metagenome TaxID=412755 RepID=X1QEG8_9ZZZZ
MIALVIAVKAVDALAVRELEKNNYEAKGRYINKAIDIINELNAVLDTDSGGEIATNLRKLY